MRLEGADLNLRGGGFVVFFKYSIKSPGKHMIQGHRHKRLFISKNKVDFPLVLIKNNMHIFELGQGQPTFLTHWEGGLEFVHGGVASGSLLSFFLCAVLSGSHPGELQTFPIIAHS